MRTIDGLDSKAFTEQAYDKTGHLSGLHEKFESKFKPAVKGVYEKLDKAINDRMADFLGLGETDKTAISVLDKGTIRDHVKRMYSGGEINGKKTLGLKEISGWKINKECEYQCRKAHAGYAAEVIGTEKENLRAKIDGKEIITYRVDDIADKLGDNYKKNDEFVDKVRLDKTGKILERIQTKFVGKNAEECFKKLCSKAYSKYFDEGKVDKIEVPKDYYDDIKNLNADKIESLNKQLDRVKADGKTDVADKIQSRIDRCNKIDRMLEKSTVTSDEAMYAVKYPDRYVAKLFAEDITYAAGREGIRSGAAAAGLTVAVSSIDNIGKVLDGEITTQEAALDITKETGAAVGLGCGTAFISTAVSQSMSASGHALIRATGNFGLPAATISFGVESYESIADYAQGMIDGKELAYDLGRNGSSVVGGTLGTAAAGAVVGSVVPGAGTATGFAAGMVGGLVGTAITSEAYETAVEHADMKSAEILAGKAQAYADKTIESVKTYVPEKANEVKAVLTEYFSENELPIKV